MTKTPRPTTILWVEDDLYSLEGALEYLRHKGHRVLTARDGTEALAMLRRHHRDLGLVILDVMLPPGDALADMDTFDGRRTGLVVARTIHERYPNLPLLGASAVIDPEIVAWYTQYGAGYLRKPFRTRDLLNHVNRVLAAGPKAKPRCFIVHGHDYQALYELKNFLQNELELGEPLVLREQPSQGRTIIEKYEDEAQDIDLVFVLLTPDDTVLSHEAADPQKRQPRQNVMFELGFFYSKFQRRAGRVLLLHKGSVELPSDISGITYIDISAGIEAVGQTLRRELREWL